MEEMVRIQLDFPKDFVKRLDNMVKQRGSPLKDITQYEWLRTTSAGQSFYREMAGEHRYVGLSNAELNRLITAKMREDLGVSAHIGRPSLMRHRVDIIMEAFNLHAITAKD